MPVFLGNSRNLMGNWICFAGFWALCCQCIPWPGIFIASWYQIGTGTSLVHPWRLRSVHPWWWDRDFRGNNYWTWWGHVDLVLKFVGYFPSSYSVTFGCTEGRGLVRSGCTFWGTMADFSLFAVVEGLLFSSHYLPPWKISGIVAQLRPFGSRRCWKMALGVLGSSRHGLIHAPWWWHFLRKNCRGVEYYVGKIQRNLSLVLLLFWWHRRDGIDNGSSRDQDTNPLLHGMPTCLSQLDFHGW